MLLLAPLNWAVQIAFKLPTMLLGLVVVPFLYKYRDTPLQDMPWWSLPWVNPEDWYGGHYNYKGSVPKWWVIRRGDNSLRSFYKYHAIRNPADGLRNFKWLQLWIDPAKVKYWTPMYVERYDPWNIGVPGVYFYFCWQGAYAGFEWMWVREKTYTEIKFGFRVEPRDAHYELPENHPRRKLGASFASKFIINREWNV